MQRHADPLEIQRTGVSWPITPISMYRPMIYLIHVSFSLLNLDPLVSSVFKPVVIYLLCQCAADPDDI